MIEITFLSQSNFLLDLHISKNIVVRIYGIDSLFQPPKASLWTWSEHQFQLHS